MKRNMFGEMKIQPDDDLRILWSDEYNVDWDEQEFEVLDIEEDENFGWGCTIRDSELNESELQDFGSRTQLIQFLTDFGLEAE